MSHIVSLLRDALGVPPAKVPIDVTTFISYVLPAAVAYFVVAVLALTPRTGAIRVALWPVVASLAFRAAVSVDMSHGSAERAFFNMELVGFMSIIAVHSLSWTLAETPLVRRLRPANSSQSIIMDALDLVTNFRGHGWDWSNGLYIPRETRPANRVAFASYALFSALVHGYVGGVLHLVMQTFTGGAGSGPHGPTIFDESLPFFVRYLRASIITPLGWLLAYSGLQMGYDFFTIFPVLLFGQDPAQWPPAFDSPWNATSLGEFWDCRWHQWYRHMTTTCAYPFSVVLGPAGKIIGTFLALGLFHHVQLTTFNTQIEMWHSLIPFGMMAPGILAEQVFHRWTGRNVGGTLGRVWTYAWLLLWTNVMIDGFAKAGWYRSSSNVESQLPLHEWIEKLVMNFDAWLHTI